LKTTIRTIAGRCAFSADELTGEEHTHESPAIVRAQVRLPYTRLDESNRVLAAARVELSELTQPADVHFQFETLMFLASKHSQKPILLQVVLARDTPIAVHREQMFRAITGNCHSNWPPQYMWILAQGHQLTPI
jgi:hypothetical protein